MQTTTKGDNPSTSKNGLLDKILKSVKNIGVTATVAAVAVVGVSTLVTTPTVELLDLYVESTSVVYHLTVEELDMQNQYAVVISTGNDQVDSFPIEENGQYEHVVEGLKPEWEYTLSFVSIDQYLGEMVLMQQTFQTKPEDPPPDFHYKLDVYDIAVVGLNQINLFFTHENLDENCLTELVLLDENSQQITVPIGVSHLHNGYVTISLDGEYSSLSVTPVIRFADSEDAIQLETYNHTFTQTLDVDVMVDTSSQIVAFFLKAVSNDATQIHIADVETGDVIYSEYLYSNKLTYYYELPSQNIANYTLYLTNDDGQKVSDDCFVTFDTSFSLDTEFTFNYKNPGDVGITYNSDGTINAYIQTDFQADNPDVYYQILLGDLRFTSREEIFCAIGLPDENYGLTYNVLIEVDGVAYSIYDVMPSGTINEFNIQSVMYATVSENSVMLTIDSYMIDRIYLSTVRLQSSAGEEIFVDESDWTFDENYQQYSVTVEFSAQFEYVDIFAVCIQSEETMSQFQDYVGSIEKEFTFTIYK